MIILNKEAFCLTIKQKQTNKHIISLTMCPDHRQLDLVFICCLTKAKKNKKGCKPIWKWKHIDSSYKAGQKDKAMGKKEESEQMSPLKKRKRDIDAETWKAESYILWKWSSFRRLVGKWTVLNYPSDHRYNLKRRLMNFPPDSVFKFSPARIFGQKWTASGRWGWDRDVLYTIIYASLAVERTLHRFPVKNVYLCEYPLISDNNLLRGANTWQGMVGPGVG